MNQPPPNSRVVISINAAWNIINFRLGLIRGLQQAGYEVVALAPPDEYSPKLQALGVQFEPIVIDRKGRSPLRDLLTLGRYLAALRRIRPDVFLGYTIKPNIYGSLAANLLGIPVINNIAGLGTVYNIGGWLNRLVNRLYRLALARSKTVFFQNSDDLELFVADRIVRPEAARLLPGSGVDLAFFAPGREPPLGGEFRFLLVTRLLWAKGIGEYVEAARLVRKKWPRAKFQLAGFVDVNDRLAVAPDQIETWREEGIIDFLGRTDDVRPLIEAAHCIVLPSYYREGLPRVLIEAAAMAKPLVASDIPGNRQIVRDGVNGFLCEPKDVRSLAQAMSKMLALEPDKYRTMAANSRQIAEAEFDERFVIELYRDAIRDASASA